MKARIYRDIDALKIWGNDYGMRFLRDPDDKTKYKVYFTDVDIDKLESFVLQQQAEIEALKKHNEELQKACIESLVWVMGNGVYCSLDIEVILKNVLGSEWEDYK